MAIAALCDQACLSLALFLATISVARNSDAAAFGEFALVQMTFVAVVTVYRLVFGSLILTSNDVSQQRSLTLGIAVLFGGLAAALLALPVLFLEVSVPSLLIVCWVFAQPAVDAVRMQSLARSKTYIAACTSLILLLSTAVGFVIDSHSGSSWVAVALYAIAATSVVGMASLLPSSRIRFVGVRNYLTERAGAIKGQFGIALSQIVPTAGTSYVVALSGGVKLSGALRGAQSVVGLPLQFAQGLQPLFIRRYYLQVQDLGSVKPATRFVYRLVQVVPLLALLLLLSAIPSEWGESLLGDTWDESAQLFIYLILASACAQLSTEVEIHLRVHEQLRRLAVVQLLSTILIMGLAGLGAAIFGIVGMGVGILAGNTVKLLASIAVERAERRPKLPSPGGNHDAPLIRLDRGEA